MSTHTPGPWHCESSLGLVRSAADQRAICAMPNALNKRAIKMRKPGDDAEITPDARLIAAAPELLAMLVSLRGCGDHWLHPAALEALDALIAKATGGDQ